MTGEPSDMTDHASTLESPQDIWRVVWPGSKACHAYLYRCDADSFAQTIAGISPQTRYEVRRYVEATRYDETVEVLRAERTRKAPAELAALAAQLADQRENYREAVVGPSELDPLWTTLHDAARWLRRNAERGDDPAAAMVYADRLDQMFYGTQRALEDDPRTDQPVDEPVDDDDPIATAIFATVADCLWESRRFDGEQLTGEKHVQRWREARSHLEDVRQGLHGSVRETSVPSERDSDQFQALLAASECYLHAAALVDGPDRDGRQYVDGWRGCRQRLAQALGPLGMPNNADD